MEKKVQRSLTGLGSGRDSVRTQDSGAGHGELPAGGAPGPPQPPGIRPPGPPRKPRRGREPGGQDPGLAETRSCPEGWGRGELSGRFPSSARPRVDVPLSPGLSPLQWGAESGVRPPRVLAGRPGFSQLAPRGLGASGCGVCGAWLRVLAG